MNRIKLAFEAAQGPLLNVYFTAGFPQLNSTRKVLRALTDAGADMVEIGMPYSDPLADGTTIQESSSVALANGMTIDMLFDQLEGMRLELDIPVILMGYVNPVMQYGVENFLSKCSYVGVDGLILPDVPMELFDAEYAPLLKKYDLDFIFLITPETEESRIRQIDDRSTGFIYMVSSSATTGNTAGLSTEQKVYFSRIREMKLKNHCMIGFGIHDRNTFTEATQYADGAIVGSAFIKQLSQDASAEAIERFVAGLRS
jgi:tryptophan synthase alpha chain